MNNELQYFLQHLDNLKEHLKDFELADKYLTAIQVVVSNEGNLFKDHKVGFCIRHTEHGVQANRLEVERLSHLNQYFVGPLRIDSVVKDIASNTVNHKVEEYIKAIEAARAERGLDARVANTINATSVRHAHQ